MRGRKLDVAPAASAATRDDELGAVLGQVREELMGLGVVDLGSDRDGNPCVGSSLSELVLAAAVLTPLRADDLAVAKVQQRRQAVLRLQDDVPTPAAVPSRGASERDELLPTKRNAAVAAIASDCLDRHLVDEIHRCLVEPRVLESKCPRFSGL